MDLAWSPDGKSLATAGAEDGSIKLWDAATGKRLVTLRGSAKGSARYVAWSPSGKSLASLALLTVDNKALQVWDPATGLVRKTFTADPHCYGANGLAWSPDGQRLFAAANGPAIQMWQVESGANAILLAVKGRCLRFRTSPRFTAASGNTVGLLGSPQGQVPMLATLALVLGRVNRLPRNFRQGQLALSPDGKRFALAADGHTRQHASRHRGMGSLGVG